MDSTGHIELASISLEEADSWTVVFQDPQPADVIQTACASISALSKLAEVHLQMARVRSWEEAGNEVETSIVHSGPCTGECSK